MSLQRLGVTTCKLVTEVANSLVGGDNRETTYAEQV